ncbi:hypothetical protein [Olsenella sp. An188]|uniref:hypothetical protein n=1 Tax=Olsenella sp. An188 TaxID=1965579 RepID=UPI000B390101|nr:hypothetical protein [Olsenella sp. An188]OUP39012.1 hypothetical protein B5F23_02525 [Olsenella sp. An188]HJB55617.1 hypothetical protein [Candidatus Olsenella avistercoris]
MIDLKPSVPRTPAQAVLRIVSIFMALLGALALLGGVLVLATDGSVGIASGDLWAIATFGGIIVVVAGLLLLTAVLGLAASNNSARVGPYRFLCYLVGLGVLVAIAWGWGLGTFILFNPIILTTTIVYVLVCSRLADKVKEEHDSGVRGETFLRSRHQRVLHLLSEVVIMKGVLTAVVAGVLIVALLAYGEGEQAVISGVSLTVSEAMLVVLAAAAVSAGVNLLVGCLGIWGSNRPQRIRPFLVLSSLALAADVVQVVVTVVEHGPLGPSFDLVFDLLFMAGCTYLAVRILRQPTPEELMAQAVGAAMVAPVGEQAEGEVAGA